MSRPENIVEFMKVLFGAIVFVAFGVVATSKLIGVAYSLIELTTQMFLYLLFICSLSFGGYYFVDVNDRGQFVKKFFMFSGLLLPNGLIFWFGGVVQLLALLTSFVVVLVLCLSYQIKSKDSDSADYGLLVLWTIWVQLNAILIFEKFSLLPSPLLQLMGALRLDALATMRIGTTIVLMVCLLISAIAGTLKSHAIWGPYHVGQRDIPKAKAGSSAIVKLVYIFVQTVTSVFINSVVITLLCNIVFFGVIRVVVDFLLRVCKKLIYELQKLLKRLRIILCFLILYVVSITILFFINATASPLIKYLRGSDGLLSLVAFYCLILLMLALFFKILVTMLFTEFIESEGGSSFWYNAITEPLFSDVMAGTVVALLVYMSSWWLWGLARFNFLQIEGFNSLGILTKWASLVFGVMMVVTLIWIAVQREQPEGQKEEKHLLKFTTIDVSGVVSRPWVLIIFVLFAIGICWYGLPKQSESENNRHPVTTKDGGVKGERSEQAAAGKTNVGVGGKEGPRLGKQDLKVGGEAEGGVKKVQNPYGDGQGKDEPLFRMFLVSRHQGTCGQSLHRKY